MSNKDTQKKTVLFVAPYFPPHSGGLERYLFEVTTRFDTEKWSAIVLTTGVGKELTVEKVGEVALYRLPISFTVSNTPFSFSWFLQVKKLLKELNPDLINVHMPVPGLGDVVTLLKKRSTPLVVTYHTNSMKKGYFLLDLIVGLYESIPLRFLLWRAHHIVCVSDSVREDFLSRYKHKSSTITPGVDTVRFIPDATKRKEGNILFVAGLGAKDEHKGLDILFNAFVLVKKKVPEAQLTIVGDGDKREWYERRTRELGIDDAVRFTGYLDGAALVEEFQKASLFALPTKNESFGMVIAEAMATGLPVVSTRVGGVPLLVDHGTTGLLTEPGRVKVFASALIDLLQDKKKREGYGVKGMEKVSTLYSWEDRVHSYNDLFLRILGTQDAIAHLVAYYPPHVGGMEVVAQELAVEQSKRGKKVHVFTSNVDAKRYPSTTEMGNCSVHRLKTTEVAHTPILWMLPYRLLTLPKNSVLHVHLAQLGLPEVALLIARLRSFPLVFHFHLDVEPSGILGPLFVLYKKYILGFVLRRGNRVIVFSEEQKQLVVERYGVAEALVRIIPNGVGEEYFNRTSAHDDTAMLQLLYVGRLTVQKRVDRLLLTMKHLTDIAELTIVGDGEDRKKLQQLAADKGLKNVTFAGRKNPEEVRAYHRTSDVFITTSDKEGMPLSVLEAHAAGLVVVASDVMGLRELVQDAGVLVSPQTPEAFAEAVKRLHNDRDELVRLKKKSVQHAEQFTWKKVADSCMTLYEELLWN